MIKKFLTLGILLASLCFATSAFADYAPSGDTTVQATTSDTPVVPSIDTGDATFQTQKEQNNTVKDTSGINSDHSVNGNGEAALAANPPVPCF